MAPTRVRIGRDVRANRRGIPGASAPRTSEPRSPGPHRCVLALTPTSTDPTDAHAADSPASICVSVSAPNRDGKSMENGGVYQGEAKLLRDVSGLGNTSDGLFCAYQICGAATTWDRPLPTGAPARTNTLVPR